MTKDQLQIFPWDDNFNTGIADIDQQHKRLVELINELANKLVYSLENITLEDIFADLIDYTVYHFSTEEGIWAKYFEGDDKELKHHKTHQHFIEELNQFIDNQKSKSIDKVAEDTLDFLVRWLASHILESDRFMAYVVLGLQAGLSHQQAEEQATDQMTGFTRKMIDIVLSIYGKLTSNTLSLMREVSRHKDIENEQLITNKELKKEKAFSSTLINAIPDLVWLKDPDGYYLACNQRFEQFFGYPEHQILGKTDYDFVDKEIADFFRAHDTNTIEHGAPLTNEETIQFKSDGHTEILETIKTPLHDEQGTLIGVLGIGRNITDRKKLETSLKLSESRLQEAQQIAQLGNWELDLKTDQMYWSDEMYNMFSVSKSDFTPTYDAFFEFIHPEDRHKVEELFSHALNSGQLFNIEHRVLLSDGTLKFVHHRGKNHFDSTGKAIRSVGTTHDITLIHKQQDQLEHMAHHDQLTGLPNRGLFLDRLKQSIQQITRLNGLLAVLFIDLDNFKAINDSYGHDAGDELLVKITQTMTKIMREGDTLSRFGGDEFAILLYNINDKQQCKEIMERLLTKVSLPLEIKGHHVSTSVSIGATLYPQIKKVDADMLVSQADKAMYKAKQDGKNKYKFFVPV